MKLSFWSCVLIGGALILVALAVACGDDDTITLTEPSQISCERLTEDSYRYHVEAVQDFGDIDPEFTPEATPLLGYTTWSFSELQDGEVEGGNALYVSVFTSDGGNMGEVEFIRLEDAGYMNSAGQGWQLVDTSVRPLPVRFRPSLVCEGLVPDLDLPTLETSGQEKVNGIVSYRYDIDTQELGFLAKSGDFDSGSDIGAYAHDYTGSIWIAADGGYPSRIDLIANGHYPDGRRISVAFLLEISDMGGDVNVEPPDIQ